MGLGDGIRKFIDKNIDGKLGDMKSKVRAVTKAMRKGGASDEAGEMDKIVKDLEAIKKTKDQLQMLKDQVGGFVKGAKAAQVAAQALKEANVVAAALNPASAAITLVQDKLVELAKEEIKDLGSAVNIVGPTIEKIDVSTKEMETEMNQAKKDQKDSEEIQKSRNEMLGRG